MEHVVAKSILNETSFQSCPEVVRVEFEPDSLLVSVAGPDIEHFIIVYFEDLEGFRVLDERDMLEFWPVCSSTNGWLYEIESGGWLSQEVNRPGCLLGEFGSSIHEYLVIGVNACVSVLTHSKPIIQ